MLVVLYAVIREKEKGVPCMGCFSCDLLLSRIFVFGLRTKNLENLKNLKKTKNLKKLFL